MYKMVASLSHYIWTGFCINKNTGDELSNHLFEMTRMHYTQPKIFI